jgi:uncharacterized protein (DUF934 family)
LDRPRPAYPRVDFPIERRPCIQVVFEDGVGYDTAKLVRSANGMVGLR